MSLSQSVTTLARKIFRTTVRPLAAARLSAFWRTGLPDVFRPPLEFLVRGETSAKDRQVQARVEKRRAEIERSGRPFQVISNSGGLIERSARDVTRFSCVSPEWGMFLYLCAKAFRSQTIVELGTSLGISSSYLVSSFCEQFVGIEGSKQLAKIAKRNVLSISPTATVVHAMVDEILEELISRWAAELDLLYVDANHNFEPTLRYMDRFAPHLKPGALVIFDDIHWSEEMWEAWRILQNRQGFSHALDLGRFGLCRWQGGTIHPKQYSLAFYTGWIRKYPPSSQGVIGPAGVALVLLDVLSPSLASTAMTSFLVGSIFGDLSAGTGGLHHFVKLNDARIGAFGIEERFQSSGIFAFKGSFVFIGESFFLLRRAGAKRNCEESGDEGKN